MTPIVKPRRRMADAVVRSGRRTRVPTASLLAAEFRAQALADQVHDLSRKLCRLRGAALDVLHALPEERGPALSRLRLEMAGRGQHRADAA